MENANASAANNGTKPSASVPLVVNGASSTPPLTKAVLSSQRGEEGALERTTSEDQLAASLDSLKIEAKGGSVPPNGSLAPPPGRPAPLVSRDTGSNESLGADSSSELGNKPPSLDGKSITSGTTFALDEKESLRPDDSASVKAGAEDDDAFSLRGSRMGSDVALRARGVPLGDFPDRRLIQSTPGSSGYGILTPQSTSSEQQMGAGAGVPPLTSTGAPTDALNLIYRQAPDEKLIEALESPKDRMFLLRLEKDVIDFVENSKEPYMDLPPSNSFCRMLTHKLADYYHMTHSFEPNIGSVRIFRTPFCRVPTSLANFGPPQEPESSTPPPAVLPKKIMRRGQEGGSGGLSAGASKPASESGGDAKEKNSTQKPTREEREEAYKLARERIFGSSEETSNDNDTEAGISRASSVSGNKSTASNKLRRNKRRDDSDTFDSRHSYTPYWGPSQQTWVAQYGQQQHPYHGQVPPNLAPGQHQGPGWTPNPGHPAYNMPQQYQQQQPQQPQPQPPSTQPMQPMQPQRYPGGSPMIGYGSPMVPNSQQWQQSPPYQGRGGPGSASGVPYAFGQLPANTNPHDPKSQHPIPGSYSRMQNHNFNPKTQSFVPGGQPPFTAPGSHHGSPQIPSQSLAYPGYQHQIPPPHVGGGYSMMRQASSSSAPGYPASHHMPNMAYPQSGPPPPHPHHPSPGQPPMQHPAAPMPNRPNVPQGPNQMFSHLPTYGNPATLPQKPATGI